MTFDLSGDATYGFIRTHGVILISIVIVNVGLARSPNYINQDVSFCFSYLVYINMIIIRLFRTAISYTV